MKIFGNDNLLVITMHHDNMFTEKSLLRLKKLTLNLGQHEEIRAIVNVFKTTVADYRGEFFEFRKPIKKIPETEIEFEELKKYLLSNPLFKKRLISDDGRTFITIIIPKQGVNNLIPLADKIKKDIADTPGPEKITLLGYDEYTSIANKLQEKDLNRFLPVTFVFGLVIILFICKYSIRRAILSGITSFVSALWLFGLMAIFDMDLNLATLTIPSFIRSVTCSRIVSTFVASRSPINSTNFVPARPLISLVFNSI